MSNWARYFKEREGYDSIEKEDGFIVYRVGEEVCYIKDLYTTPKKRQTGLGSKLADEVAEIAKKAGCKYLMGSVWLAVGDPTGSMKALLNYGMHFHMAEGQMLYFKKEL